jgi:hypothetical protein
MQEVSEMLKSILAESKTQPGKLATAILGALGLAAASIAMPASAQELETFDPDEAFETTAPREVQDSVAEVTSTGTDTGAIDADLTSGEPGFRSAPALEPVPGSPAQTDPDPADPGFSGEFSDLGDATSQAEDGQDWVINGETAVGEPVPQWSDPAEGEVVASAAEQPGTYGQDDLIGAAEGVFGKGAKGLAGLIEDLLRKQGEPNGYIVGREAGGAFIFGARYGSGTLFHKVEGERKVYWTGPSLGFDAGANAGNTFVLVYNLFDSEDIFKRYPAGEGQAYLVGGLYASYMRRGDVVLIPIRMGAGLRLGVNAGYMRFSKKHRWLPF